jgi:tetratricopeptide (TPR) repeat protein
MTVRRLFLLVIIAIFVSLACGNGVTREAVAQPPPEMAKFFGFGQPKVEPTTWWEAYRSGQAAKAEKMILPLESDNSNDDLPLLLLSSGSICLSLGDYRETARCLQPAVGSLEGELGSLAVAEQVLSSESGRLYRGFPHERVLAHTYLGLAYMQQNKLTEARVEFAKAAEEDKGTKPEYQDDFAPAHFLDGLRALRAKDYQYARVSFRKVVELQPEFALGWYSLSRASLLDGDESEAEDAWNKFESLAKPPGLFAKDGSTPCAIFMVDVGWGPERVKDEYTEEFGKWKEPDYPESKVLLTSVGGQPVEATKMADTYFQASTTGGFMEDVKKKVVSAGVKGLISSLIPSTKKLLKSNVDTRAWSIAPGEIRFAVVPVPAQPTTVELKTYDKKGKELPRDYQMLYYIVGRPYEEAQLIYTRILPDANNRESR